MQVNSKIEKFFETLPNTIKSIMIEVEADNKKIATHINYNLIVKKEVGIYLSKIKSYCAGHFSGIVASQFCSIYYDL